jgi:hypothetical protein
LLLPLQTSVLRLADTTGVLDRLLGIAALVALAQQRTGLLG